VVATGDSSGAKASKRARLPSGKLRALRLVKNAGERYLDGCSIFSTVRFGKKLSGSVREDDLGFVGARRKAVEVKGRRKA